MISLSTVDQYKYGSVATNNVTQGSLSNVITLISRAMVQEEEQSVEPFSMEYLRAEYYPTMMRRGKPVTIVCSSMAIISLISSITLLWMMRRSHVRFSTPNHRLLVGLSIGDIIFSLSNAFFNAWKPIDLNYIQWNARGNSATCTLQGFAYAIGVALSMNYNISLLVYYLLVIKYEKSDDFIRHKVEPYLHVYNIVTTAISIVGMFLSNNFNDSGSAFCLSPEFDPPHCIGYDNGEIRYEDGFTIPCSRGGFGLVVFVISFCCIATLPPAIIGTCFYMILREVMKTEKKLSKYGVGSLKLDLKPQPVEEQKIEETRSFTVLFRKLSNLLTKSTKGQLRTESSFQRKRAKKKGDKVSQSRAVMYKALAYTVSYFLTFTFFTTYVILEKIANVKSPLVLDYMSAFFVPLQGFYNLAIFLYPRVLAEKKKSKRKKVTWRQAIIKAFWSKGTKPKKKKSTRKASNKDKQNEKKGNFQLRKKKIVDEDGKIEASTRHRETGVTLASLEEENIEDTTNIISEV